MEWSWELLREADRPKGHPGTGELDLVGFVRMLDAHGVRAPWCVEAPGDLLETLTAQEASRRSGDGMPGVLEAARAREE